MAQVVNKRVRMTLLGLDGNAFSLMGNFGKEARRQGWTSEEIAVVTAKCMEGDYQELIRTLMAHIEDNSHEDDEDEDWDFEDE